MGVRSKVITRSIKSTWCLAGAAMTEASCVRTMNYVIVCAKRCGPPWHEKKWCASGAKIWLLDTRWTYPSITRSVAKTIKNVRGGEISFGGPRSVLCATSVARARLQTTRGTLSVPTNARSWRGLRCGHRTKFSRGPRSALCVGFLEDRRYEAGGVLRETTSSVRRGAELVHRHEIISAMWDAWATPRREGQLLEPNFWLFYSFIHYNLLNFSFKC